MLFISKLFTEPEYFFQQLIIVVFAICCHEYMHARVALWQGDSTAADQGHLTLNPLKQMGPISLLMLAFVGLAWGQVPVNPNRMKHKYSDVLVSFAGPATNLMLFLIFNIITAVIIYLSYKTFPGTSEKIASRSIAFFQAGAMLNFLLFTLNMLPAPPLDGWHIISSFFPKLKKNTSQFLIFVLLVIVILGITCLEYVKLFALVLNNYIIRFLLEISGYYGG